MANPNESAVQTASRPAGPHPVGPLIAGPHTGAIGLPVESAQPRPSDDEEREPAPPVRLRTLLIITVWSLLVGLGLLLIAFRTLFGDAGAFALVVGTVSFGLTSAAFLLADRGGLPYYLLGGATAVTLVLTILT